MASTSKSSGSAPIAASSAIQQAYKSHQAAQAQQAAAQSSPSQGGGGISIKGLTQGQVNRMAGILGATQPINTTFSDLFSQNLFNYMESGNRTSEMTNHYLNLVNGRAEAAQTADERNTWLSIANDLNGVFVSDLYSEKDRLTTEGDALKKRQEYANNVMRSTSAAMNGYGEGWSGYAGQQARNDKYTSLYNRLGKDIEANAASLEAINSQIFDALASDDIKAMRDRLTMAGNAKQTWEVYSALGAKNQHEAGMMKMNEQAELDRFVESLGQKPQYYNFNDRMMGVGGNFVMKTAGAATNLVAAGANEADFYNSLPEDLRMLVSDPEAMSKATPEQLAQMDAYRKQFDANSGNGGRIAQFADSTEKWADKLDLSSQREIEKTKQGLNKYGQFGIDMASTALDIGFDTATGLGLGSMFARVAGQGIGEARRAGATSDQQIAYGLTQATIEILTEKMSDGLSLAYGKGVATDIVEDVIKKLGASSNGANLLRLLAGAIGEGGEEVISDLLNPFTQWIIDQNARDNRTYELDPSELLRDFLLGSSMGLLGSVGEAATGGYTEKNGAIYNARAEADIEAYGKLADERQALADDTKAKMEGVRAGEGTIARSIIDGYYQGKDGGISSQRLTSRITQMLNNPAEMRIFERETGQKIQGATIAEQRASVKQILESGKFATDSIKAEAQKKAGELKEKETAYEQNKSKATKIYEKVLALKVKEASGADIAPEERLTKEEFSIAAAAGWVSRNDRGRYGGGSVPTLKEKASNGPVFVTSKLGTRKFGKRANRHDTVTNGEAEGFRELGYKNHTDQDHDYEVATGKSLKEANAEADSKSWDEAHTDEPVSGGDAARAILSNYSDEGLVEIWREGKPLDKRITSADFAEEMVRRELWTEKQARQFLGTVKKTGAPASERHRAKETDKSSESVVFTDKTAEQEEKPVDQEQPKQEAELPNDIDYIPQNAKEYAVRAKADAKDVVSKIKAARESGKISGGFVSKVKWSDFAKMSPGEKLTAKVGNFFRSLGNKVKSNALDGQEIIIDERSVKDDIAHGISRAKACTFKAVPDVLANGVIVDDQKNWKGRGYDTKIIAAPVEIDGKPAYVGCVVRSIGDGEGQRFYLHEVVDGNGDLIFSFDGMPSETEKGPDAAIKTGIAESDTGATSEPTETSIPQEAEEMQEKTEPQETPQNAPETQPVEEGTPVAPEEEKTVKPQEEPAEAPTDAEEPSQQPEAPAQQVPDPHTPGRRKEHQDKSNRGTKGETSSTNANARTVDAKYDSGDGTYISRTNEARSETARALTDTEEKATAQFERLMNKEKGTWNDDDVVIAQKLRGDYLKAIRDYLMHRKSRMPRSAYAHLQERYNALTLRHEEEKGIAGQELQAKYNFSRSEEILNRAAQTFLGFAKDGIFTGATPNATNAKIYAGIEDAVDKINKAVDSGDAGALAQVCKDISDIRNVKRMFGPLAGYVSSMENTILTNIANQENGVAALETLALGNLNAICDDVQPYKVVNAAKTIRIMNMLSNMSTIVNNITNNIASGMTSTNALSQWASDKAANAFRGITGEPVLAKAQQGWLANKEIRNAEWEALQMATLVQMYGVNQENGKLEIKGDQGLFNPNANGFEQTMALYKFFIGMGVEATDQVKSAGLQKAMQKGIDDMYAAGKISDVQKAEMEREAKHEVDRLLYKDDSKFANTIQYIRDRLNDVKTWGNDDIGTIGLGDIAMAFAKVPANVVRARLLATPEGCLYQVGRYVNGVQKAKRMHSEVLARQIAEKYAPERAKLNEELNAAYDQNWKEIGYEEKQNHIKEINEKIAALDRKCWNEARQQCSGGVYKKLVKQRDNYGQDLSFDQAVSKCKYNDAKEMSQFEMAQYSRAIGKAATSAGMVALGAVLRGLGALRDFDNEPDDELRKMYAQKGYKGLMLNLSAIGRKGHEWRDGDNILSADFLEVIALPLAIGACATDSAILAEKGKKTKSFFKEMGLEGLGKAFEAAEDIPGMADAIGFYNAFNNQYNSDNAAKGNKLANSLITYAANSIPSFFIPNAFTQAAAGLDNTVRDVYTTDNVWQQAWNIVKNKGGLAIRSTIPASVDMWGNERKYGENRFWGVINKSILPGDRLKYRQDKYESEIIRLSKAGYKGAIPKISVNGSFEVDGETYTMDADEKRSYKQNRNTEQAAAFRAFIDSDEYDMLTDDQKVAVLKDLKMDCERDAKQTMLNDRGLDVEVTRAKWETELQTTKEQITYLSMKQIAGAAWDSEENRVSDYAAMDAFLKDHYGDMTKEMREIMDSSLSQLDKMYDARKVGIDSEMWQKAYDIYKQYNSDEGEAAVDGGFKDWEATEMWTKMEKATGANSRQMNWFEENMGLMRHMRVNPEHYQDLTDKLGWSREASSNLTKAMSELQPSNGNKTVSYKQRLRCIAESKGTTDDQKWEAFYEYCPSSYTKIIKGMTNLRNRGYTYEQALKSYKSGKNSMWWVYENEK